LALKTVQKQREKSKRRKVNKKDKKAENKDWNRVAVIKLHISKFGQILATSAQML
jgi:hypothetical protein